MNDNTNRLPGLAERMVNLAEASFKWRAAKKPMRSPEEVARIFEICKACELSVPGLANERYCTHPKCGCRLTSVVEDWNKIALATENCPLAKWDTAKMGCCLKHSDLTIETSIEDCKRLLQKPPGPWPKDWVGYPNIIEAFRQLLKEQAHNAPAAPSAWQAKRGIVICGGGWRFFPSLYVTIRMIRRTGCELPIQVWYLGDRGEFDPRMEWACRPFDVGWVCANSFCRERGIPTRILGGWEMKPLAALHAPFETVISLDADSYPAYNPEEFLDHPEFKRVGAAFWPDQGATHAGKLLPGQWERFGLPYHDEPGWESGQFVVDKSRHWRPLWLTWWMNQFSDYVYKHMYGDKDTFHICWRLCGHEVCVPTGAPGWHVVAFLQKDFEGRTLFVHRTRDKFRLTGDLDGLPLHIAYMTPQGTDATRRIPGLPHEEFGHECLQECDELLRPERHFTFREGTWDKEIWRHVTLMGEYELPRTFNNADTILDVGGHIGSFAHACLRRGAGKVISYEPDPENASLARKNLARWGQRAEVHEAAIWDSSACSKTLSLDRSQEWENTGARACGLSTVQPKTGARPISVAAVGFDEAVNRAASGGRIRLLKVDCEGAEWPILATAESLHLVDEIVGETHACEWNGQSWTIEDLQSLLQAAGFSVSIRETPNPLLHLFTATRPQALECTA